MAEHVIAWNISAARRPQSRSPRRQRSSLLRGAPARDRVARRAAPLHPRHGRAKACRDRHGDEKLVRLVELADTGYASVVTPDARSLLGLSPVRRRMHVVDLASLTVVRTIDPDCDPAFAAVAGNAAYLSCPRDGKVAVLDLPSMTMRPAIPDGDNAPEPQNFKLVDFRSVLATMD